MLDEQQDHARSEKEEDELGERVGRPRVPECVNDRGHDQKHQGGSDRVTAVEARPDRVRHVGDEEAEEDLRVGKRHVRDLEHRAVASSISYPADGGRDADPGCLKSPWARPYNSTGDLVKFT